ncbi:MAG: serine/threonine protein kinase [Roseobacter sp.]
MNDGDDIMLPEASNEALAPGSKLLSGQYEILRYLSSGGFGITYLARDSLNRTVVIKECFPEAFCSRVNKTVRARTQNYVDDFRSIVQLFIREAHSLSRLSHSSVVGVHQVFEYNETAYMALDLVDGRDLLEIIETGSPKFSANQVRQLTLELLDAIGHVHSQDLLHRDISPDNILVDKSGRPVLIDFGAAREEASRKSRVLSAVLVVKDGYSPQEFYVAGSQQYPCSDLYAFAATLSHLIAGQAPPNSQARLSALASGQPDLYEPLAGRFPEYDDAFLEAIDKAMNIVPAERMQSAEEWVLMIDHTKRVEIARAKAQKDKTIDLTVMNLVKSVNELNQFAPKVPGGSVTLSANASGLTLTNHGTSKSHAGSSQPGEATDKPKAPVKEVEFVGYGQPSRAKPQDPEEVIKDTPYIRVTSRAIASAELAMKPKPIIPSPPRISRFLTVPVVFSAYFFYTTTMLQYDEVRAATLTPVLSFGNELSNWNFAKRPQEVEVKYHRGPPR